MLNRACVCFFFSYFPPQEVSRVAARWPVAGHRSHLITIRNNYGFLPSYFCSIQAFAAQSNFQALPMRTKGGHISQMTNKRAMKAAREHRAQPLLLLQGTHHFSADHSSNLCAPPAPGTAHSQSKVAGYKDPHI